MRQKLFIKVICLALAFPAGIAVADVKFKPDTLLAVDSNRSTVIDGVVATWGAELEKSGAGITSADLRTMLERLRADKLLAASLAGSLSGLRDVLSNAAPASSNASEKVPAKALGDASNDVVYTPVAPCRLVETRSAFNAVYHGGGPFAAGEIRTYVIQSGNGVCTSQLPNGLHPSAVQLQVFGIPANGVSGDIEIQPQGAAFGSTATLVFLNNVLISSAGTTSAINLANNEIAVLVRTGSADVAIDLVGYFEPPKGGYVKSVTAGTGGVVITGTASDPVVSVSGGGGTPGVGAVVTITDNYSVAPSDYAIFCNNPGGGTKVVTLPDPTTNTGRVILVKRVNNGSGIAFNCQVSGLNSLEGPQTLAQPSSGNLTGVMVMSDGTSWWLIGNAN